ncbi:hypothetical protein FQA39_LY19429 [Lamprigera yunnana]|nr:hypothetical protein FQA39_LY19429 [Lamprigera yunnana]
MASSRASDPTDAPHGLVLLVVVLELLQRRQHGVPAALGDADGEHDEERVQARFFDHHAVLGQVFGDDGRGDAGLVELAIQVEAGRDDGGLDGGSACRKPSASSAKRPLPSFELLLPFLLLRPLMIQSSARPMPSSGQLFGPRLLNPPVLLAKLGLHLDAWPTRENRALDRYSSTSARSRRAAPSWAAATSPAGDDAVLRLSRCASVRARLKTGFEVELLRLLSCTSTCDAWLIPASSLWMDWVCVHRMLFTRLLLAHGVVAAVEGVEGRMRQPGLVKNARFCPLAVELLLDGFGVVEHAVVSGLRERQHARLDAGGIHPLQQRVGGDLGLYGLGRELALMDRADDAEVVARRLQEHRNRTRHDDGVQDGFVAVAIDHHHIAGRHRSGATPFCWEWTCRWSQKAWSALKMRAALRSLSPIAPL